MNKVALLLTASFATSLAALCLADYYSGNGVRAEVAYHEQVLDEMHAMYPCFKGSFDSAQQSLEDGEMCLKDACSQVVRAARQYAPVYLKELKKLERGDTDDERVANNLIDHLRERAKIRGYPPAARLAALEAELESCFAK